MFFKYNIPGILWAVFILILLGLPGNDLPDTSFLNIPQLDKIVHTGLFLIFAFLLARGFYQQQKYLMLKKYFLFYSLTISIGYGGLTEILQGMVFQGRTSDIIDFVFDGIGSTIGIFVFHYFKRKFLAVKI